LSLVVDCPRVSHIIQMGVPANDGTYVHRVGDNKTGRGDLVLCSWEIIRFDWSRLTLFARLSRRVWTQETAYETFMAQVGFYFGRVGELGFEPG